MNYQKKIRVLLVDDSNTVRVIIKDLLANLPGIEVAGEAANGLEALDRVAALNPDLVIMDVQMPVLNGFEATEQIMARHPKPILILSSVINQTEVFTSMKAIELGALDVLEKPEFTNDAKLTAFAQTLVEKIQMLARIPVITHLRGRVSKIKEAQEPIASMIGGPVEVVGIGASTGGPLALKILLSLLSPLFEAPIIIVQHITAGFIEGMAGWLRSECKRKIEVAQQSQILEKKKIYLVPNGYQPVFTSSNSLVLNDQMPPERGFKPSIDVLFSNIADQYGHKSSGILLTGMGDDGAKGLRRLKEVGAITIAQDQLTSIVFGMPKAAIEMGAVQHVLPVHQIPALLDKFVTGKSST